MKKEEKRGLILVTVVIAALLIVALSCGSLSSGSGGGDDLSSTKWDKYFGCLVIQEEWGNSKTEAREICKRYRP